MFQCVDCFSVNVGQQPLLTVTVQYPVSPDLQNHPPILLFNLQEIRICVDPLLCRWLLYSPKNIMDTKIEMSGKWKLFVFSEFLTNFIPSENLKIGSNEIIWSSENHGTPKNNFLDMVFLWRTIRNI